MMHIRTSDSSEMSNGGLIATLTDDNNKSLREYDFTKVNDKTRKCKIKITPDSEYKILIKNNNSYRVLANIEIDGTTITNSKLIINAYGSLSLESFIESHKKLKAVFASHEAVQDPSSGENGLIRVELFKEKQSQYIISSPPIEHHHHYNRHNPFFPDSTVWCSSVSSALRGCNNLTNSVFTASVGDQALSYDSCTEKMATVEGSESDQRFVTDYTWRGVEGDPYVFKFELQPISAHERCEESVATMAKIFNVSIDKARIMMDEMAQKLIIGERKRKSRKK